MKPVKLYFAGAWAGKCSTKEVELGIKNKLVSYIYPDQLESWLQVTQGREGNIILDSGAFSVWKSNKTINIDDYIRYAHEAIERGTKDGKKVRVVNLDVIPGKPGETENLNKLITSNTIRQRNQELIEEAARQGYKNLKIMVSNGIIPIHVYHQGENIKWLDRMLKYTNYIGISPANDVSVDSKKDWIHSTFEYLYKIGVIDKVDTHGFAVWIPEILREFPWTSCDAATWRLVAAWGGIYYPTGGFKSPTFSEELLNSSFETFGVSSKRVGKGLGKLTPNRLEQLQRDGYSYDDLQKWEIRAEINIKFFLALEKWLNEYKKEKEYKPYNRLL